MQNLNDAIATGRITTGDVVTFDDKELITPDNREFTICYNKEFTWLLDKDGSLVYQLPRYENQFTGTGQYMISANNVIHHTFERKLLNSHTEYRL